MSNREISFWIEIALIIDKELISFSPLLQDVMQRACISQHDIFEQTNWS